MPVAFALAVMLAASCLLAESIARTTAEHELSGLFGSDAQARRIRLITDRLAPQTARDLRLDLFAEAVNGTVVHVLDAGTTSVWELPSGSRWNVRTRLPVTAGPIRVTVADQHPGWLLLDGCDSVPTAIHDATPA